MALHIARGRVSAQDAAAGGPRHILRSPWVAPDRQDHDADGAGPAAHRDRQIHSRVLLVRGCEAAGDDYVSEQRVVLDAIWEIAAEELPAELQLSAEWRPQRAHLLGAP